MSQVSDFVFKTFYNDSEESAFGIIAKKVSLEFLNLKITIFPNKPCRIYKNNDGTYTVYKKSGAGADFVWTITEEELCKYIKPDTRYSYMR